ncbi:hypothetical protein ANTPLA_LOCUS696 [Anthophora plagiata]
MNQLNEAFPSISLQGALRESPTSSVQTPKRCLPRINLPSFSGSYESWLGFHDLFKSLVDDDKDIPDIEKLYHLKGCLRDEAAEALASIELSSENYRVAWSLLKERYDNRKIIRQTHVKALLNLQCISKETSVRSLIDQVQKHVRALEALKESVDKWDTLLIEIIKQKLTGSLLEKWEDASCESTAPTFNELLAFLQRRVQLEDAKIHQTLTKFQVLSKTKLLNSRFKHRSQHAFVASATRIACPHCKKEHSIYHCEIFKQLPPMKRFEETKKHALCINCLHSNYRSIDCTAPPCRICHKRHNFLLHFDKKSEDKHDPAPSPNQSIVNLHAQLSSEGLLATAVVKLLNAQGKEI